MKTVLFDVDTQRDLIDKKGKMYIEGAEDIRNNLGQITNFAREEGFQILGSVLSHTSDDEELSENPDYENTFPPHCLENTEGQQKVQETTPDDPLWIGPQSLDPGDVDQLVDEHDGEIFLRKRQFDLFSNPNTERLLEAVDPFQIVVVGLPLDVSVQRAVLGFLDRDYQVTVVEDSTKALHETNRSNLIFRWKNLGVQIVNTDNVLRGFIL